MSPMTVSLIGILVMLILILLRMPVAFALLLTGVVGSTYMLGADASANLLAADVYGQFASYGLSVVPLFILMGQLTYHTGISERLFSAAYRWIGALPGGVAATTILASIGFSAVCGSNAATTATMGSVAMPELKRYNYDTALSTGSVAVGGTLGVLIPPSTALIVVAIQSEQSIARLFVAAMVPGLIVGVLLVLTALAICWRKPHLGPPAPSVPWSERFRSLTGVIEAFVLFAAVIGGLYQGVFTPTEAGAAGSFGAILIALARRKISPRLLWRAVQETLRLSAFVVLLIAGAVAFGRFLTITRMPFELADWAAALPVAPVIVLLVILVIYLIGGALMDALGFLVVSIPIFFPVAMSLGFDLVWFTIIVTLMTTLGAVTPPVGVNVYIIAALDRDVNVLTVFRGVAPFFVVYALAIAMFIAFPGLIST